MIKGIIFDFDGLIFDTETHHYNVLNDIFIEHGSTLPLTKWQEQIGTYTDFSPYNYLEEQLKRKLDHKVLKETFEEKFHAKLSAEKARSGVEDYLESANKLGLKIGLASSSNYEWVSSHLKKLGLFDYFQCIKTADDVETVKPDPSLYLEAAKCLQLNVQECLVFEDSANGSLAAKRAGMSCVIVPNEVTEAMDFCEVDYRIGSMSEISLEDIIKIVGKSSSD
ncbi:HAD family hydrolase [Virgibacillus sp. YIM 98842]|uniref:HAD family hydrolase n=1 Tax=Virgibacillus sp. YIM 98842 TaxID=2663533 RepID=UPI0013D9B0FA|nr:HAD family hydrolase [Virgibacillus sp. YIM 98842]